MSLAALLQSTYDVVRIAVPGLPASRVGVHYDGQPPASSGQAVYVSIHPAGWQPGPSADIHEATEEEFGIGLTITMRTSQIPRDQWGKQAYLRQVNSLEVSARELYRVMHERRYDILQRANAYLNSNQFVEPLMFDGTPLVPQLVEADWFHADPDGHRSHIPDGRRRDFSGARDMLKMTEGAAEALEYHGMIMELRYWGARRICPSRLAGNWILVSFLSTRETSPAITGQYGGSPDSITVDYMGSEATPTFSAGNWVVPAGTWTFPVGSHDITAKAVYDNGQTVVQDNTVNEITILDTSKDWVWEDGSSHIWEDGQQATWNSI